MRRRDYRLFLQDIQDAIQDAQAFVSGMDYEAFLADRKTQNAVVHSLEIIGEAAKHIPQSVRDRYSDIP